MPGCCTGSMSSCLFVSLYHFFFVSVVTVHLFHFHQFLNGSVTITYPVNLCRKDILPIVLRILIQAASAKDFLSFCTRPKSLLFLINMYAVRLYLSFIVWKCCTLSLHKRKFFIYIFTVFYLLLPNVFIFTLASGIHCQIP